MLKIDLLPRHFAVARTNRFVMVLLIIALAAVMGGWVYALTSVKGQIGSTKADLDEVEPKAKEVERIEGETNAKQAELNPIAQKVDFVADADESGAQYWDRYHDINEYVADFAQVTRFSITNPGSVNFTAIVGDTTEAARFVLNLIQCPALSGVSISGLPAGVSIEGAGGTMGGGFSPMGGPMGMEPGMEMGAPPPGAEPGMMMEPGMMGAPGMGGGGQVSATGEITLSITATLTESVGEPMPPGAGGGAAGMGAGMGPGMGPEMMGPGMAPGMEPGMGPGMEPGGGAPPPAEAPGGAEDMEME